MSGSKPIKERTLTIARPATARAATAAAACAGARARRDQQTSSRRPPLSARPGHPSRPSSSCRVICGSTRYTTQVTRRLAPAARSAAGNRYPAARSKHTPDGDPGGERGRVHAEVDAAHGEVDEQEAGDPEGGGRQRPGAHVGRTVPHVGHRVEATDRGSARHRPNGRCGMPGQPMPGPGAIRTMDPWRPPLPPRAAPPPRTASPASSDGPQSGRGCWASPSASRAARSARAALALSGSASPSWGRRGWWWRSPLVSSSPAYGRPIPPSSGPPWRWAAWRVPAPWSSRRSATTATPRPPRPCSGRPPGCWSAGRRVSPAPRGGPDPVGLVEALAAGALGLALAAEGIGRLDFGWFHSTGQVSHLGRGGWLPPASSYRSCSPEVGPPASWPRSSSSCWPPPSPPSSSWPPTASASPDPPNRPPLEPTVSLLARTPDPARNATAFRPAPYPVAGQPVPGDRPSFRLWWSLAALSSGPSATSPWGTRRRRGRRRPSRKYRQDRPRRWVGWAIRATCSAGGRRGPGWRDGLRR